MIRLSLSMAILSNSNWAELHRIVLAAKAGGGQQKSQNLRIGLGGPAGQEVEKKKHEQTAEQAVEQVESRGAKAHGEEKEFSLRPEDGQRPIERSIHSVDSSGFWHVFRSFRGAGSQL